MIIIPICPKCGADLLGEVIDTDPPIERKYCSKCSWFWEGSDKAERVPFDPTSDVSNVKEAIITGAIVSPIDNSMCDACSSNPKNGGDGICNCILRQPKIT